MSKKLPSFQFYPGDWLKDAELRSCGPAARGIWMDIICLSFESKKRGVLSQYYTTKGIRLLCNSVAGCRPSYVRELVENGVLKVAKRTNRLWVKRVVRDEITRKRHERKSRHGGKKRWSQGRAKGEPAGIPQAASNSEPKPCPSSSSSSSSSKVKDLKSKSKPSRNSAGELFQTGKSKAKSKGEPKVNGWKIWIDARRSRSLADPAPLGKDIGTAKRIAKAIPDEEELLYCFRRYLDDRDDPRISKRGHPISWFENAINKYRDMYKDYLDRKKAEAEAGVEESCEGNGDNTVLESVEGLLNGIAQE